MIIRGIKIIVCCLIGLVGPAHADANSDNWEVVGQGRMNWGPFKLYDIELYTFDGQYRSSQFPQALEITYHRAIKAKHLIEATAKQWQHLNYPPEQYNSWINVLRDLWPNVRKGDTLRFEVGKYLRNRFYYNGQAIGGVDSTDFSEAFIAIWLSPNTTEPELRKLLIQPAKKD